MATKAIGYDYSKRHYRGKRKDGWRHRPRNGLRQRPDIFGSDPIPCQWTANKYDKLGKVNGEHFTVAHFSILIEAQPFEGVEQVRLKDLAGKELGEFSIMQIEPLEAVCQLRIFV